MNLLRTITAAALLLVLAGCGSSGGGDEPGNGSNAGIVGFTRALAATAPETGEPDSVDSVTVVTPEDAEPESVS